MVLNGQNYQNYKGTDSQNPGQVAIIKTSFQNGGQSGGFQKPGSQNGAFQNQGSKIQPRDPANFNKPLYDIKTDKNRGASNIHCYWNPNTKVEPCIGGRRVIRYQNTCSGRSHSISAACV